jgi:two-component system chemotaxis response regulator CheB
MMDWTKKDFMLESGIKPYRVLIADDSDYLRRLLSLILECYEEFDVIGVACDGRECLEMARRLKPDLITLDMNMPDMDGMETLRRLHETQPIPVIMVSSLPVDESPLFEQLLELGAAGAVSKPFTDGAVGLGLFESKLVKQLRLAALNERASRPTNY